MATPRQSGRVASIRRAFIRFGPFELQPSLDVARCRDEEVLQSRFGQSAITITTHSVGSGQFADGTLDAVALMHSFFKRLALLLDSTRLQQIVIFSHHNGTMSLLRPDALGDERATMAMSAPLETVLDPMICAFFEPTALRIVKSSRTDRLAPGDVDGERFDSIGFWDVGSPWHWVVPGRPAHSFVRWHS